ncbi:hypothetical protein SAMN05443377_10720 [Propionibacterium cyclohexanicum]|uniref:Arc-like DNA binding domain-containing protein n=1 Tax=Propionibacterium cyclohexanicum TaxID=64702 RepID=A0A1H9RF30_9ACTN|nr:hypothetical protein [Propionibacterium cyclohexanicum]SER71328.1 hypothetical protein SAMN05443377_10720 [Propionibacterium cyclohexanicum]
MSERKAVLVRLDPRIHEALQHWASDEMRSVNAQVEYALRDALRRAGRLPSNVPPVARPGRPPSTTKTPAADTDHDGTGTHPDRASGESGPGN